MGRGEPTIQLKDSIDAGSLIYKKAKNIGVIQCNLIEPKFRKCKHKQMDVLIVRDGVYGPLIRQMDFECYFY